MDYDAGDDVGFSDWSDSFVNNFAYCDVGGDDDNVAVDVAVDVVVDVAYGVGIYVVYLSCYFILNIYY